MMIAEQLRKEAQNTIKEEYSRRDFDLWFMRIKTPWYVPRSLHERLAWDAWEARHTYQPEYFTEVFDRPED